MKLKEFAELAGVSVSTVSKIMNHKDESISAETRKHVLKLAKEYHYQPYSSTASPAARTLTIGVLLRSSSDVNRTVPGILSAASKAGYSVLLRESNESAEQEYKQLNTLLNLHVDGLIWEVSGEKNLSFLPQLEEAGISYQFFQYLPSSSTDKTDFFDAPSVPFDQTAPCLDYSRMGYLLTQALVEKGHKSIACLLQAGKRTAPFYEGYRRCLFDHQLNLNKELVFHVEDGIPVQKIAAHQFSGIAVSHYAAALKLYQEIDALHYRVPYDLSVVSLRDEARLCPDYPPLSTLAIPHFRYGQLLAAHLIARLEKKELEFQPLKLRLNHTDSIGTPYGQNAKRIISCGSINIDTYLNVDVLPHSGRTVIAPTASVYPGGKCINQAIGAAKLGHHVCIIGCVGTDTDADLIYSSVKALSIDTQGLKRTQQKTGQAYIFVQQDGESMISIMSGANNLLTPADIRAASHLFSNASFCLLQTEIPLPAIEAAAELAKKNGVVTVLKPSALSSIPEHLLTCTDLLVPNEEELNEICKELCHADMSLPEKAHFLLGYGVRAVIVTRGAKGCYLCTPDISIFLPAAPFSSVDSSGAGDAFISALVSYLLYGYNLETAARIASYAAGYSITRQGVSSSLVDRNTLEAYILQKEPALLRALHLREI